MSKNKRNTVKKKQEKLLYYSPLVDLDIESVVKIAREAAMLFELKPENFSKQDEKKRFKRFLEANAYKNKTVKENVERKISGKITRKFYGNNTGYGKNSDNEVSPEKDTLIQVSRQTLEMHAVGYGKHAGIDVIRATLAVRITSLAKGYSGVSEELVNTLIEMLNKNVFPCVSSVALGASGDVAPLAHLFLPCAALFPGEDTSLPGVTGACYVDGKIVTGKEAMEKAGITPVLLQAGEGLALINSTDFSTAIAALTCHDARQLFEVSVVINALSAEALLAYQDTFLPYNNEVVSENQATAAEKILNLLEGSEFIQGSAYIDLPEGSDTPHDSYSLRCSPDVLGAVDDTLQHAEAMITRELRAVNNNPLIHKDIPRKEKYVYAGNFHGARIGYPMDFIKIAMTDLSSISERRMNLLLDPNMNKGLPPFLMENAPTGFMITQYTGSALVMENITLASPASVLTIPTSAMREDHISMSPLAARGAKEIAENTAVILGIELLCAYQAIKLRTKKEPTKRLGKGTQAIIAYIDSLEVTPGKKLGVLLEEVPLYPYMEVFINVVNSGRLLHIY